MIEFVKRYGYNVYSQNGEDGIINECIKRLGGCSIAIEIGAPTREYCSNICNLSKNAITTYYDINPEDDKVIKKEITPENINEFGFFKADNRSILDPEGYVKMISPTILSIDIDGNDYAVWKAYEGKPAIVIIEINSSLDPSVEFFQPDRGASYITMLRLGEEKGYFLLCHTGNMVFVANEYRHLFPEIGDPYDYEKFFDKRWLLQPA